MHLENHLEKNNFSDLLKKQQLFLLILIQSAHGELMFVTLVKWKVVNLIWSDVFYLFLFIQSFNNGSVMVSDFFHRMIHISAH